MQICSGISGKNKNIGGYLLSSCFYSWVWLSSYLNPALWVLLFIRYFKAMIAEKLKKINYRFFPGHLYYAPSWIILGVNNICNLHCKMCDVGVSFEGSNFYQNLMASRPINMPEELIMKVIDQTAMYFPKTKIGYAFTEPLIYPHLIASLKYAHSKNLYTTLTTNGLNLRRFADQLLESGLNELFISLDGPQDIHNEIRGNKNSFQKAVEGIDYLLQKNTGLKISIFCVITEWNIGQLMQMLEYFEGKNIEHIGFMHTNYTPEHIANEHNMLFPMYPGTASNVSHTDISKMDLDLLWYEMEQINARKFDFTVSFSPKIDKKVLLNTYYKSPELFIGKRCRDINTMLMVKSNGEVIPAHGRCYNLTVGTLYDQSLKEIWNSQVFSKFRRDISDAGGFFPACSRCCSAFGG